MKEKTCCFSGHRTIPANEINQIKELLSKTIEMLIKKGVVYYGCGGAVGFDMLAAQTIIELKKFFPQIKLIMVYPCQNQTKYWNLTDTEKYNFIKANSDKRVYISEFYNNSCMIERNKYLVNYSSYCICYFNGAYGGTEFTVKYAKEKGLKIINLYNKTESG